GELMEVMNLLRAAGYLKIALVGLETLPSADAPEPGGSQPSGGQPTAPSGGTAP
ncbi:MAG: TonB system transport protein ExbD, partial [Mesorhizobium sp.]